MGKNGKQHEIEVYGTIAITTRIQNSPEGTSYHLARTLVQGKPRHHS